MKSMTGYARNEALREEYRLSIEIKCYNNRYLDIGINLPGFLSPFEPKIRAVGNRGQEAEGVILQR